MVDRVIETQFRFISDRQATSQVLRDNARIDDSLNDIDDSADRLEKTYTDLERSAERQARASREASEASVRAAKEQSALFGDVASRTGQLSGALSGLGAIGGQRLMIAADILDAVEAGQLLRAEFPAMISQLGLTTSSIVTLGAAAAIAVPALIVGKKVLDDLADSANQLKGVVAGQIGALQSFYDFIADATAEQVFDRLQLLAMEEKQNQLLLNDLMELQRAIDQGLGATAESLEEALAFGAIRALDSLGALGFGLNELDDAINQTEGEIEAARVEFGLLDQALRDGTLAAEEARRFQEENTRLIIADLERRKNLEIEVSRLIREGTSAQTEAQIAALNEQRTALEAFRTELETLDDPQTAAKLKEVNDQLFILDQRQAALINSALPAIKAREAEEAAIKAYNATVKEATDAALAAADANKEVAVSWESLEAGAQAIADAEADRLRVVEETAQAILDVQRDTAQKRADLIADADSDIAKLTSEFNQDRIDAERDHQASVAELTRDFRQDQRRDLQDFNRDRRRAEEDHRDSMLDSAGKLDAVGLLNEQRNFVKTEKRAKEDFKIEQRRRADQFRDRLRQENEAFKREKIQAERSYRERERDLRDSLNRQLADLRTAQTREIAELRGNQAQRLAEIDRALDDELRALTGFTEEEQQVRSQHYVQMLDELQQFVTDANAAAAQLTAPSGAVGPPAVTTPGTSVAVGQFPLAAGLRAPSGMASPLASQMAMGPPVGRSQATTNNAPQVTNNFSGMDRLTPGQIRNVVKIVNNEMLRALA
ncbi:MAG: coiled-coil domain-containing protein [Planctomycetota bacterium]|jgi:hypothetical protein